jgi:hypothetical protein
MSSMMFFLNVYFVCMIESQSVLLAPHTCSTASVLIVLLFAQRVFGVYAVLQTLHTVIDIE